MQSERGGVGARRQSLDDEVLRQTASELIHRQSAETRYAAVERQHSQVEIWEYRGDNEPTHFELDL